MSAFVVVIFSQLTATSSVADAVDHWSLQVLCWATSFSTANSGAV